MGANPAASQGSLLAAPNVMALIDAIGKRGKVIVIDPVRTRTAEHADEWLPIVPGTDAALLLAVTHTLFAEDLAAPGPHVEGVDTMRRVATEWPPSRVSAVTGIDEGHWPANWPAPKDRWCTAVSACAIRSSAAWPVGWSTSSIF